ncbi:T6SS immunity protein Tli3 family protein [Aromatoleum evansii]|uniref:Tli3-like domain-containing protein n=1 Tax=Aromatoleum evansii TaxID=59406 RepID=A0ABZ1AKB5_AROEV|nr:hypothetical protein [Aromatoleum evansii]NMG29155.1 hypothetical protein [Aromatoleum evansii]WRL45714.1 hypothetical protein U5817_21325 [Aromatoleum evansii]
MSTPLLWLISAWTLLLAAGCARLARGKLRRAAQLSAAALALGGLVPILPSNHAQPPRKPATQVIYRFDDHRHLEIVGYACEGAVYYVDIKRGIRSSYMDQFARLFLPRIVHADNDGDFIFMPYSDVSGFAVSKDYGKTFEEGSWVGTRYFGAENISAITVVNQQAFIETKDGRLFMTSKPFGEGWGRNVIDPVNELPTHVFDRLPEFQNLPRKIPEVKNYTGWTEMHCDPDLEGEPIVTPGVRWNRLQGEVLDLLGRSVALPVTLIARAIG